MFILHYINTNLGYICLTLFEKVVSAGVWLLKARLYLISMVCLCFEQFISYIYIMS